MLSVDCLVLLICMLPLSNAGATSSTYIPTLFSETGKNHITKLSDIAVQNVGFFHVFRKPPWGGGNQFLLALAGELRRRGVVVTDNEIRKDTRLYMANAITFKTEPFRKAYRERQGKLKLVHRLDGPYYAARYGIDPRLKSQEPYRSREDDRVYEINEEFACASIFQSRWSLEMNRLLGYKPKEPVVIINNAVDHEIFHNRSRIKWDPSGNRKIKIISSSWSDGERKGFNTFKWLDEHLDFDRFEYTFIGNLPENFTLTNIQHLLPVGSEELAPILRDHDIYIAASYLEPCSNALLEALASGLPTLYQDGSGHNELVKHGGYKYQQPTDIPRILERLIKDYEQVQDRITYMTISEAADKYLAVYRRCLHQDSIIKSQVG
mmetsp:Transcript_20687/g.39316  ORF Transcript_20687/g.39316 Transcript_20687/m.39316 type:complete len:379 (-) Transcript_20687:392-1528(-)